MGGDINWPRDRTICALQGLKPERPDNAIQLNNVIAPKDAMARDEGTRISLQLIWDRSKELGGGALSPRTDHAAVPVSSPLRMFIFSNSNKSR